MGTSVPFNKMTHIHCINEIQSKGQSKTNFDSPLRPIPQSDFFLNA